MQKLKFFFRKLFHRDKPAVPGPSQKEAVPSSAKKGGFKNASNAATSTPDLQHKDTSSSTPPKPEKDGNEQVVADSDSIGEHNVAGTQAVDDRVEESEDEQEIFSPPGPQEILWDQAYDSLKEKEPKLMEAYEKLLSSQLENDFETDPHDTQKNIISQESKNKRRQQMKNLIASGLKRTENEAKIKDKLSTATDVILSTKNVISTALSNVPQAALAWGGVCVALEFLTNPLKATAEHRSGIGDLLKMMAWNLTLSDNLFKKSSFVESSLDTVQEQLKTYATDLFQEILKYQANSICSLYGNRGIAFIRDAVNLNDWNSVQTAIKEKESHFNNYIQIYTSRQNVENTGRIVDLLQKNEERQMSKEDQDCLRALSRIDVKDEKKRIELTKGGLHEESYNWILANPEFCQWRQSSHEDSANRLLWLKGAAGKGKTMMLCGIINELRKEPKNSKSVSFFFCQATDGRINNSTAVLCGLLRSLIENQPSLITHVRKKYNEQGEDASSSPTAWVVLSDMLRDVVQDKDFCPTYLAIDALDECVQGLSELLELVTEMAENCSRVKWILVSRVEADISVYLDHSNSLSLEINAKNVSKAVNEFIRYKIASLESFKGHAELEMQVLRLLHDKADGTFLWVALVFKELQGLGRFPNVKDVINAIRQIPSSLDEFYDHMMGKIRKYDEASQNQCYGIISITLLARRPLHLLELFELVPGNSLKIDDLKDLGLDDLDDSVLQNLVQEDDNLDDNHRSSRMEDRVSKCGSFLTVRDKTIYFVHQSAKEFFQKENVSTVIFPSGQKTIHCSIYSQSLECMHKVLHRNIYGISHLGLSIDDTRRLDPDPLVSIRYACVYWADHLSRFLVDGKSMDKSLPNSDALERFFTKNYLYWLEALSLLHHMADGVVAMGILLDLKTQAGETLAKLIQDAHRFILSHKWVIENYPLQTYISALIFSPSRSKIRECFRKEEPDWIATKPVVNEDWDAHLTLRGHTGDVTSVSFSLDGLFVASASNDKTIRIWETASTNLIRILRGHKNYVTCVEFSPDGKSLASISQDKTVRIWEVASEKCTRLIDKNVNTNCVTFSPDGCHLAFSGIEDIDGSYDSNGKHRTYNNNNKQVCISIYNANSGDLERTLYYEPEPFASDYFEIKYRFTPITFSPNGRMVASTFVRSIYVWELDSNQRLVFKSDNEESPVSSDFLTSTSFSPNSESLSTNDTGGNIKIWDPTTGVLKKSMHKRHIMPSGLQFLHSETKLASCDRETVRVWDIFSEECVRMFASNDGMIRSMTFSPTKNIFAVSCGTSILLLDINAMSQAQLDSYPTYQYCSVTFSKDGKYFAVASSSDTKIWDTFSTNCICCFEDIATGTDVFFSPSGKSLAYILSSGDLLLWDLDLGRPIFTSSIPDGYRRGSKHICFSADGKTLGFISGLGIVLWNAVTGECTHSIGISDSVDHDLGPAVFSDDMKICAVDDYQHTSVKIFDTTTGECIHTLRTTESIINMYLSGNGRRLAVKLAVKLRSNLVIWDLKDTPQCIYLDMPDVYIRDMVLSPDGEKLHRLYQNHVSVYNFASSTEEFIGMLDIHDKYFVHLWVEGNRGKLDRGYFDISFADDANEREVKWLDYGFSADRNWITLHGQNVVWLPSKYKATNCQVQGLTVGTVNKFGVSMFIVFSSDRNTWPLQRSIDE